MKRRTLIIALGSVLLSCEEAGPRRGVDDGTLQRFSLKGEVIRVDEGRRAATIRHGPISDGKGKVWMEAMTMEFPVVRETDLKTLQKESSVTAAVVSRESDLEFWIEDVRAVPRP